MFLLTLLRDELKPNLSPNSLTLDQRTFEVINLSQITGAIKESFPEKMINH
jgi:hypothetical protein